MAEETDPQIAPIFAYLRQDLLAIEKLVRFAFPRIRVHSRIEFLLGFCLGDVAPWRPIARKEWPPKAPRTPRREEEAATQ